MKRKKPKKSKIYIITIALIVMILIVRYIALYLPPARFNEEPNGIEVDKSRYPITGIDISRHTGKVDFQKIKEQFNDTIDFVFIKTSEGANLVDVKFDTNYNNAVLNDIPVGPYHFFKFNVSGKRQAANFLHVINNKIFNLPLVLDVEEWSNTGEYNQDKVINEIRCFILEVEIRRKEKVMIYTNESSYQKYIQGNFESNKIWICSFSPHPKNLKNWTFWQHSHNGKLEGAEGWIDINTFNGTRQEWNQFLEL
ncbi:MAG TPA: GH25 family lysozyme [Prolixibacteraceae bacterium]|nr:GH25 family lysozyme [Prolixibacteraceae bacterium]